MDDGQVFSNIESLNEVYQVGSLCKMTLTPQEIFQKKRTLITLEGIDRIKLLKELSDTELEGFFQKAKEAKIQDLNYKLDNAIKLKQNNQIVTTSAEHIRK